MKLIPAWIVTTLLWLLVWIPFYILGFFCTWLGLIFCNRNSEHMWFPWWFWDNNHGINGTIDYNNLNWVYICNKEYLDKFPSNKLLNEIYVLIGTKKGKERNYSNRWLWTTWRNPVSNLSMYLLGVKITKPVEVKQYSFWKFVFDVEKSGFLWSYALTIKYTDSRGFFYRFGWKFSDPSEGRARFIYRISPYKSLT